MINITFESNTRRIELLKWLEVNKIHRLTTSVIYSKARGFDELYLYDPTEFPPSRTVGMLRCRRDLDLLHKHSLINRHQYLNSEIEWSLNDEQIN
jgi:hypothetical protein